MWTTGAENEDAFEVILASAKADVEIAVTQPGGQLFFAANSSPAITPPSSSTALQTEKCHPGLLEERQAELAAREVGEPVGEEHDPRRTRRAAVLVGELNVAQIEALEAGPAPWKPALCAA